MDWHFRRNRKDREGQGRGAHRKWLPKAEVSFPYHVIYAQANIQEWANEVPQAGPSSGRELTPSTGPKLTAAKLAQLRKRWIRVPQDPAKKLLPCPVCKEVHKPEWAEDEEEWVFRNAIDISGTVSFHLSF
jgi:pre-mRNA cleavage complex 2 protein Pcf11